MSIDDTVTPTPAAAPGTEPPAADVSVIVCAYTMKRWAELCHAIESALAQSVLAREVILVVDGNLELHERALVEFASRPGVRIVDNHHGPGLSGGRNTGADAASGAVLVFLDDDAVASSDWLREHLAAFADPDVLGAGGEVEPLWQTHAPGWLPKEFYWVIGCSYTGMPTTPAPVRNPIGANMSIRADVFREAGGFQQELGRRDVGGRALTGTADETEFCIRSRRHYPDGVWMWRPSARVRHSVPAARCTWRHFVDRCRLEGGSKAVLVRHAGPQLGLASERRYLRVIIPRGILRELGGGLRGDRDGARRAGALIAGVLITAETYARARVSLALGIGGRYVS